jgi:hypothetical protein
MEIRMAKPAKSKKKNNKKIHVKDLDAKRDPKGGPTAVEKPNY